MHHEFLVHHASATEVERRDAISQAFQHTEVLQRSVVLGTEGDAHVHRTFPIGVGEHLIDHDVGTIESALAFVHILQRDNHLVGDGVGTKREIHAAFSDSLLVHGNHHGVGGEVAARFFADIVLENIGQFVGVNFGIRLLQSVQLHFLLSTDGIVGVLTVIDIADSFPGDGQRGRVVGGTLHLVGVPVRLEIGEVADTGVGALSFHFLVVPEREGVVVAVGEDDGIAFLGQGVQIVQSEVTAGIASGAVVVVPSLADHLQGHADAGERGNGCGENGLLQQFLKQRSEGCHAETNPDGESVERTGVGIVTFARLAGSLVQIEHNGKSRHEEQEEDHPELANAFLATIGLPEKTDETEQEREAVEDVVTFVVL